MQLLERAGDQVLVLGHLASERDSTRAFQTSHVRSLFESLRLPAPGNLSQVLADLARKKLVVKRPAGGWSITPLGEVRSREVIGDLPDDEARAETNPRQGAELGTVEHPLLPPEWAPQPWVKPISQLLASYPFDRNVFCITRFPSSEDSVLSAAIDAARDAVRAHGMTLHLANDRKIADELWPNVVAHMWACRYGIAFFEQLSSDQLNQNVLIESGAMLAMGRRCALLRDDSVSKMPTDFIAHIYEGLDLGDTTKVASSVHRWLADDLDLGRCKACDHEGRS